MRNRLRRHLRSRRFGIGLGRAADQLFGDPARWHPVAGFGRGAGALERVLYADSRAAGTLFTVVAVGVPTAMTAVLERLLPRPLVLGVATWAALGGTSLLREGTAMQASLQSGDLPAARERLTHLCARDPAGLDADELARATVESLAENTSDAVVAPLLWAALLGAPGVVAYRAINTLDAMVGYRNPRYDRFGWAAARLDDVANLVPARVTALLTVAAAPLVGGSMGDAHRVWRRDGAHHPSPNAGHCEAAAAGALGVTLGGSNVYEGLSEDRGTLGDGPAPGVGDLRRAVLLSRLVMRLSGLLAATLAQAVAQVGTR